MAGFLKSRYLFTGISGGSCIRIGKTRLIKETRFTGEIKAPIRPENIEIVNNNDGPNVIEGLIESRKNKSSFTKLHIKSDIPLVILASKKIDLREGDKIYLRIPQEKMIIIPR